MKPTIGDQTINAHGEKGVIVNLHNSVANIQISEFSERTSLKVLKWSIADNCWRYNSGAIFGKNCFELPKSPKLIRQFWYNFIKKYPSNRRVLLNYTFGVGDITKWLDQNDPGYTLILNYGYSWPLGVSSEEIMLHMHMKFYEEHRW